MCDWSRSYSTFQTILISARSPAIPQAASYAAMLVQSTVMVDWLRGCSFKFSFSCLFQILVEKKKDGHTDQVLLLLLQSRDRLQSDRHLRTDHRSFGDHQRISWWCDHQPEYFRHPPNCHKHPRSCRKCTATVGDYVRCSIFSRMYSLLNINQVPTIYF